MNDLLTKSFSNYGNFKQEAMRDLEAGPEVEMTNNDNDKNLGQFFEQVGGIKQDMEAMQELFGKLQRANEESKTVHKAQSMKGLRDRMDKDMVEVLKKAKLVKSKLEALDRAQWRLRVNHIMGFCIPLNSCHFEHHGLLYTSQLRVANVPIHCFLQSLFPFGPLRPPQILEFLIVQIISLIIEGHVI